MNLMKCLFSKHVPVALGLLLNACSSANGTGSSSTTSGESEYVDSGVAITLDGGGATDAGAVQPDVGIGSDPESAYRELPVNGGAGTPTVAAISARCWDSETDIVLDSHEVNIADQGGVAALKDIHQPLVLYADATGRGPVQQTLWMHYTGTWFFASPGSSGEYIAKYRFSASDRKTLCARPWIPAEITVSNHNGKVTKSKIRIPVVN